MINLLYNSGEIQEYLSRYIFIIWIQTSSSKQRNEPRISKVLANMSEFDSKQGKNNYLVRDTEIKKCNFQDQNFIRASNTNTYTYVS